MGQINIIRVVVGRAREKRNSGMLEKGRNYGTFYEGWKVGPCRDSNLSRGR